MKYFILVLMLLFSFQAMSHCGSCGVGDASDHAEGEDTSHHGDDNKDSEDKSESDSDEKSESEEEE